MINRDFLDARRLEKPIFYLVHAVIIGLLLLDILDGREPGSSLKAEAGLVLDIVTLSFYGLSVLLSVLSTVDRRLLYSISFTISSLNILLSVSRSVETSVLMDLLILLSLSFVFAFLVLPVLGVSHGVITAVIFGFHIFRYSDALPWSSSNIVTILGVYISINLVSGFFAHRYHTISRELIRLKRRIQWSDQMPPESRTISSRLDGGERQMYFRIIYPLFVKSGNALATERNISSIIAELSDGEGIRQSQLELLRELQGSLGRDISQLHRGVSFMQDLRSLIEKSGDPVVISVAEKVRELLARGDRRALNIQIDCEEELKCRVNQDVFTALFGNIIDYARDSGDSTGDCRVGIQIEGTGSELVVKYRRSCTGTQDSDRKFRSGISSSIVLERDSDLLYLEFLASVILEGDLEYPGGGDFSLRLHLPIL